jgi:hypothetical protein
MTWKRERDLLMAETMALVQSVTGKTPDASMPLETSRRSVSPPPVERPADVLPARLTPLNHGDLRDEIRRRVEAFRARQRVFDRARDEYCNAMMAKARATSEQATKLRDNQPLKR